MNRSEAEFGPALLAGVGDQTVAVLDLAEVAAVRAVDLVPVELANLKAVIREETVVSPVPEALTPPRPEPNP